MASQESWSGNIHEAEYVREDPIEAFRRSIQTILGRKLAKGKTVGRSEAEALYALAKERRGQCLCGDT